MNSPLEKSIFTCCGGLWEYFVQGGLTTSIRKQELRSRISTHRTGWNKLFRLSSIRSHLLSRVISIIGHPLLKCGWILFSTWTPYQVGNFIYKTIMRRFLQALLVEQGLTVCWLCVCVVCVYLCKMISRPLIGRKYDCSDWSTSISTALRTFLGKY